MSKNQSGLLYGSALVVGVLAVLFVWCVAIAVMSTSCATLSFDFEERTTYYSTELKLIWSEATGAIARAGEIIKPVIDEQRAFTADETTELVAIWETKDRVYIKLQRLYEEAKADVAWLQKSSSWKQSVMQLAIVLGKEALK